MVKVCQHLAVLWTCPLLSDRRQNENRASVLSSSPVLLPKAEFSQMLALLRWRPLYPPTCFWTYLGIPIQVRLTTSQTHCTSPSTMFFLLRPYFYKQPMAHHLSHPNCIPWGLPATAHRTWELYDHFRFELLHPEARYVLFSLLNSHSSFKSQYKEFPSLGSVLWIQPVPGAPSWEFLFSVLTTPSASLDHGITALIKPAGKVPSAPRHSDSPEGKESMSFTLHLPAGSRVWHAVNNTYKHSKAHIINLRSHASLHHETQNARNFFFIILLIKIKIDSRFSYPAISDSIFYRCYRHLFNKDWIYPCTHGQRLGKYPKTNSSYLFS